MNFDKTLLFNISYGMYVVGSSLGENLNAQTANSVIQVSYDPDIVITACINKNNLTHKYIKENGVFSVSILSDEASVEFIGWFGFRSGNKVNKFNNEQFRFNYTIEEINGKKVPVVTDNSISYMLAEVVSSHDAGTHTIFLGKIIGAKRLSSKNTLTYADYHLKKNGITPKNAPSFIKQD